MNRYTVWVDTKVKHYEILDEALMDFGLMMYVNKNSCKTELVKKGQSYQVYGFCVGLIIDNEFEHREAHGK